MTDFSTIDSTRILSDEEQGAIYDSGFVAYQADNSLEDNPFNPDDHPVSFVLWRSGWFDAQSIA